MQTQMFFLAYLLKLKLVYVYLYADRVNDMLSSK